MNANTEAVRKMRARRLEAGTCQMCGQHPPMRQRKACRECLVAEARKAAARRAARMVAA